MFVDVMFGSIWDKRSRCLRWLWIMLLISNVYLCKILELSRVKLQKGSYGGASNESDRL